MYSGLTAYRLTDFSDDKIAQIEDNLTLVNPEYKSKLRFSRFKPKEEDKYDYFFYKDSKNIYLPRNYFLRDTKKIVGHSTIKVNSDELVLRDYQIPFMKEVLESGLNDCVWNMPCGHGKTTLAINYICKTKRITLVIVPTHFLLRQWKKRFSRFSTNYTIYTINTKETIPSDYNIYISTIDTFKLLNQISRERIEKFCEMVIFDEAHRMGATTYHPIISNLGIPSRLALTATFRRNDKREIILSKHFGKEFIMDNHLPKATVYPLQTNFECERVIRVKTIPKLLFKYFDEEELSKNGNALINVSKECEKSISLFADKTLNKKDAKVTNHFLNNVVKKPLISNIDTFVSEDVRRTYQVRRLIQKCLDEGRKPLVLGSRLSLLKKLHKQFLKSYNSVLVISENKIKDDDTQEELLQKADIIFGIKQLASEGLDVDSVDTLILVTPQADTEQAIGRIQRIAPGKKKPIVYFLIDNCMFYRFMFNKAEISMRKNAYIKDTQILKDIL